MPRSMFAVLPVSAAGLCLVALGACAPAEASPAPAAQEFAYDGPRLTVRTDYAGVRVRRAPVDRIRVQRVVTAVGKEPRPPAWRLDGSTLDLGTVCDDGYVGLCEVTYDLTVPTKTRVDVRD